MNIKSFLLTVVWSGGLWNKKNRERGTKLPAGGKSDDDFPQSEHIVGERMGNILVGQM